MKKLLYYFACDDILAGIRFYTRQCDSLPP